ncbi:HK97-gp10 family putative phage morphogenesis protein [Acinetobacter rudis]|uniref:HK97-gp10 family putative phage morphogenesis protein n=1 Tax=Acinetobacter rudis TaxID=632955 RepID=UPI003DA72BDE
MGVYGALCLYRMGWRSMEAKFTGYDEVKRKLDVLADEKAAKRIARRSARKAMNIVRDAARQNAKAIDDLDTDEMIWKNISTQGGRIRDSNAIKMRVGVRGGASFSNPEPPNTSGGDTRHWRWVEYGRSGAMAFPFMRPALATNIDAVTAKFAEEFKAGVDEELSKA